MQWLILIVDGTMGKSGESSFEFSDRELIGFLRAKNGSSSFVMRCPHNPWDVPFSDIGDGSGRLAFSHTLSFEFAQYVLASGDPAKGS